MPPSPAPRAAGARTAREAINGRRAVCVRCGLLGVHVDTNDGEIIDEQDRVEATVSAQERYLRPVDAGLICFDCDPEVHNAP